LDQRPQLARIAGRAILNAEGGAVADHA
jgi:hypothetical protein